MNKIKRGNLIVISGPSGVGKGTLVKEILKRDPNLKLSISATTRSPRPGEVDGREYIFINKDEFKKLINSGGLLEYAEYCDNYYGTPKKAVEDYLDNGKDVILEIEVQGAEQIRQSFSQAIQIFVSPPSMEELASRLVKRGTEEIKIIRQRLDKTAIEMLQSENYNYIVINDVVEVCADNILSIINAERYKANKMNKIIKGVIDNE